MIDEILEVDWSQVRFRRALSGLVAMLIAVVFFGLVDDVVVSGVMATLFVIAAGGTGPMSARFPRMARFTVYGAIIGGLAFWSSDSEVAVALVLGIAAYVGTLAAAAGPQSARAGLFLTLWALLALMLGSGDTEPSRVSIAFLAGGAIAIGVTAIRLRTVGEDEADDEDQPDELDTVEPQLSRSQQLGSAILGPVGQFAILRTVAVVAAVLLGFWWFASYPMWIAITVIVVVQPSSAQSASIGVQRTLGTALGVGVAIVVAQVLPQGDSGVVIAFLVSGLLMVAFMGANYTLFAAFLTAMLVFGQRLAEADAFEAGWERLLATAVGAIMAFGVIAGAAALSANTDQK